MALDKQILPLSLGIGIDTKNDAKQVIASKLLSLQNCVLGTGGEFNKRNGYDLLNSAGSSGNMLGSFQDQLVALDGVNLKSYSQKQDLFNSMGKKTCVSVSKNTIARRSGNFDNSDLAYNSGVYGVIFNTTPGIGTQETYISVIDSVTGQDIIKSQLLSKVAVSGVCRASALGTKIIFSYATAASEIGYYYIDVSAPQTLVGPVTLQTDFDDTYPFAFDCITVGTNLVYAYIDTSGDTSCFYIDSSLVQSATLQVAVSPYALSLFSDSSNRVWVPNLVENPATTFSANYFILNSTITATTLGQTTIEAFGAGAVDRILVISGVHDGTNGQFYYSIDPTGASTLNYFTKSATFSVAGAQVTAPSVILRSATTVSKPFRYNSVTYMAVAYFSSIQPTYFLIDSTGFVSGKFFPSTAVITFTGLIKNFIALSATRFTSSFTELDLVSSDLGSFYNQSGISQVTFDFNTTPMNQKLGNNLEIGGAILSMYDGANVVEHGYNIFPEGISGVVAAGGSLSTGDYQYSVTYEWTDHQGQLHRSAPSLPLEVTAAASDKVTLTIPTLRITDKSNVLIVVYRTTANQSQFYRVTPLPQAATPLLNNKTVDTVTWEDTLSDATIVGNTQLYTNGGEIENIAMPATDIIWTYQNRLMGVYSENTLQVGYSKQVIPGYPVEFTDSFYVNVPEYDEGVTAGIQMDDKCIMFKYNTIYYMVGQGPSPNGENNDFTTPQVISTDCGCIDKKSVVLMPRGVMFKSTKGIYILERSLQVTYIGDDVEAYNSDTITSAQMIEEVNQIRFTLDSGIVLVYDYYYDQWGTFTNINAIDTTIFQNVYTYLKPTGEVYQETIGSFTDAGALIPISFQTAWFSFNKLQGFERAYKMLILGEYKSAHTLQVEFAINFDSTIVQTVSIPVLSSMTPYQQRVFLTYQKCEAFQLTITEQQSPTYGEGLSISSLAFEVGGKKGLMKIAAANSYG